MKFILITFLSLIASPTYAQLPSDNCQGSKQEETIISIGACEYGSCYVKTTPKNTQQSKKEINLNIVATKDAFVGESRTFTSVYCIDKELKAEARTPASL